MRTSRCRSCRAEVVWCVTAGGKAMPVDVEPVEDGNVVLEDDGDLVATVVPPGQGLLGDERPRYVSHFATCPNADEHRRPR